MCIRCAANSSNFVARGSISFTFPRVLLLFPRRQVYRSGPSATAQQHADRKKKKQANRAAFNPATHTPPVHNPSTIVIAARRGARVDCFRISAPGLPKFFAHHDDMNLTSFQLFNRSTVRKDSNNTVASAQQRQQHERWGGKKTTMHTHTFT